jgi:hypothetical protein
MFWSRSFSEYWKIYFLPDGEQNNLLQKSIG